MASLEVDPQSQRYRVRFRFRGRAYERSLQTRCKRSAMAAQLRLEETIDLVAGGRLRIPDGVDAVRFLLSDGRLTESELTSQATLGELLDRYREAVPEGAKEATTLYTEGIHLRHLKRLLKAGQSAVGVSLSDLQGYVNKRPREARHGKPISSDTIKKEVATLRVAWNWGVDHGLIEKAFPSRGLSFAAGPALFGRLDGLAIEHRRGRLGRLARLPADPFAELRVQPLPRAVRLPTAEPVEHNAERREVVRQRPPRAAVAGDVEDRVEDLALGVLRRAARRRILRDRSLDPLPLRVRQIGRIRLPVDGADLSAPNATLK